MFKAPLYEAHNPNTPHGEIVQLFFLSSGRTRCLYDFASPRYKIYDDAMCPLSPPFGLTGGAPGFET